MESYLVFHRSHPRVGQVIEGSWWRALVLWTTTEFARIVISLFTLTAVLVSSAPAQEAWERVPFQPGEVLQYKVKWSFIRLGTVTIRQELVNPDDPTAFVLRMSVRSAAGLPFINVHFTNQTLLLKYDPRVRSELIVTGEDESSRTNYTYNQATGHIIMVDSAGGELVRRDSIPAPVPPYDALGLLMIVRALSGSGKTLSLATLNEYKISRTDIMFTDEIEDLEVGASNRPIRCRRFEGNALWEGSSFAGMTGAFRGWISDDEASIPVRAEVGIFLGSIVLELEHFERSSGIPTGKLAHDTTLNKQ